MRRLGYVYLILALLAGVCPVSSHESNDINVSDVWVQDVCHLNNLRNPPDFSFCGNGICENFDDEIVESCPDDCGYEPVIDHAEIGFGPYKPIPSHGDLWLSTWANGSTHDGELIFTWGDGCGAGLDWGHPDCDTFDWDSDVTDAGVVVMTGTVPDLACVMSSSGCLRTRDVPDGISGFPHTVHDDKPAGILAVDDRIYLFLVSPQREPLKGYLAYSDDDGQSWTVVEGTPWVQESPNSERSYFRCPMVINMGKNYSLNTDGYVYFLSIGWAWDWDIIGDGRVYLARVPVDSIITYGAYRYFGGMNGSEPIWIENPDAAVPVDGLVTTIIGSAIYHPGIERYLFLDSTALYEAEHPWGPWVQITRLLWWGDDPIWYGADSPGLITKDAGVNSVYFTTSGRSEDIPYSLIIGRIDFTLRDDMQNADSTRNSQVNIPLPQNTPLPEILSPVSVATPSVTPTPTCTNYVVVDPAGSGITTIQEGIDMVCEGGIVMLSDGTFSGTGNRDIRFRGKNITVRSVNGKEMCVVDCRRSGRGFIFDENESSLARLEGVTVRNGYVYSSGGGVIVKSASPTIEDCRFEYCAVPYYGGGMVTHESQSLLLSCEFIDNYAGFSGGGLSANYHSDLAIESCTFQGNEAWSWGGGYFNTTASTSFLNSRFSSNHAYRGGAVNLDYACTVSFQNCWIESNTAEVTGGGIHFWISGWYLCDDNYLHIQNCTFRDNQVIGSYDLNAGGAIYSEYSFYGVIQNSIFWGNTADTGPQMALDGLGQIFLSYSDMQDGPGAVYINGGWNFVWGDGMIDADPMFIAGSYGGAYLSQVSAGQMIDSPCLNAGSGEASDICFDFHQSRTDRCLDQLTTRTDHQPDAAIADMGAHYKHLPFLPNLNIIGCVICIMVLSIIMGTALKK